MTTSQNFLCTSCGTFKLPSRVGSPTSKRTRALVGSGVTLELWTKSRMGLTVRRERSEARTLPQPLESSWILPWADGRGGRGGCCMPRLGGDGVREGVVELCGGGGWAVLAEMGGVGWERATERRVGGAGGESASARCVGGVGGADEEWSVGLADALGRFLRVLLKTPVTLSRARARGTLSAMRSWAICSYSERNGTPLCSG
mmetsp:Transcript_54363/g.133248  ORF Transcript_54363/g.133248 Transcript_54363/m.133248 type:complete len:202 (-) Transcript_54363:78-683(-)